MRLLVSNPDTLGDVILRQPMFRALRDAGHELLLVVRPLVTPLVRHVAPDAQVLELPHEPYAHDLSNQWDKFQPLFDAAHDFRPDGLVVAPYRWTQFDERLAAELPGVKRFGMSGHLYRGDPHQGRAPASGLRFDAVAEVCEDAPEVEKNAALASTVLGGLPRPPLPYPQIDVPEPLRDRATQILTEIGLSPGEYWVACVTGTANVALKAWQRERWAETLSRWTTTHNRRFLFVGLANEEADARAVQQAMGDAAGSRTRIWMPAGGTIDELIGLAALSAGYVGHDTGPMHVAAAVGKPVLAVFGGGHKLRFQPAVEPSVTLTMGVECRGCEWVCPFAESHCVKDVPVDEVVRAVDDLESGRVSGREARVLKPSDELQTNMIRESAKVADERLREVGELSRRLQDVHRQQEALGGQLLEKESMIRQQDQQIQEKESAIHGQHALLQDATAEANRLREHATGVSAQLQARVDELARLQSDFDAKSREASELASTIEFQRGEIERHAEQLVAFEQATTEAKAASSKQAEETAKLREELQRLAERVRILEPKLRPPRSFKQLLIDFLIGPQHCYPKPARVMPGVTVVTVTHNDEATIRNTIESVIGQNHAHVQFVVVDLGSTDGTAAVIDEYRDKIDKVIVGDESIATSTDALQKAYSLATYELLTRLDPGEVYEPGALLRVAEHFRDHPGDHAAVFEEVVADAGWRFPTAPRREPDVYQMLAESDEPIGGAFVRKAAATALGGLNRERGEAAEWDLWVRIARRHGIQLGDGHVRTIPPRRAKRPASYGREADYPRARQLFLENFGRPGQIRCKIINACNRFDDALRQRFHGRLWFAFAGNEKALPNGTAPAMPTDQPVSPLTSRLPDHLLFSSRDTTGAGDDTINYVYYDSAADTALVYPPLDAERLNAIYAKGTSSKGVQQPESGQASPYAGYGGPGAKLARLLSRVRCPYWWFRKPDFGNRRVDELLDALGGRLPQRGVAVRLLNVACYEGGVLDALKEQTDWTLVGTEPNPQAAAVARGKGHTVYETSAEDAAMTLPLGERFDVIYVGGLLEHLPDPLLVLRRLRQILSPGGRIVLDTPNLDSKLVDVFGPTWSQWQVPFHRTLFGRRGLKRMAKLAAFRVERLRTKTHPLATIKSVQLNDLGLAGAVPETAEFQPEVASRGVLLTGWMRLLWDWRGRGDYLYAVLHAE